MIFPLSKKTINRTLWSAGILTLIHLCLSFQYAAAQRYAGGQDPFILGAGARALALGNSYVAMPMDATATYWNPAALDLLARKNLTLFYTPLIEGTSYNFVGYAHPFLTFGTFGLGLLHLSIGDVQTRDEEGLPGDKFSASRSQLLFSYGKQIPFNLSIGGSLKIERLDLEDHTSGVGIDFGIIYQPDFNIRYLQDVQIGAGWQNLIPPKLKMNVETETLPWRFRAGVAKPVHFGVSQLNILLGFLSGKDIEMNSNLGLEYIFQNHAMARIGHNGNAVTAGGGILFKGFQIDYAFGRYGKDDGLFDDQHRLSITIDIGKSKSQLLEIARQKELARIEEETKRRILLRQKLEFEDRMNKGKIFFEQQDYFKSLMLFSEARDLMPTDQDALQWVQRTQTKLDEQRKLEMQQLAQRERDMAEREMLQSFIDTQFDKGMKHFGAGKMMDAIIEWQRGLERDPENELLKSWIDKTQQEMKRRGEELLRQAEQAEKNKRYIVALEIYDTLLKKGFVLPNEREIIEETIIQLRNKLNYNDLFKDGINKYMRKDYQGAMQSFKEALQIIPDDSTLQRYYDDADARAHAEVQDFPSENERVRFLQAVKLILGKKYREALQILLEQQKVQRYNKRILDAIDQAREGLQNNR